MVCVEALWSRWRGQRDCYTHVLSTLSGPGQRKGNQAATRRKGAGTQMTAEVTANVWMSSINVFERSYLHLMRYIFLEDMRLFSLL